MTWVRTQMMRPAPVRIPPGSHVYESSGRCIILGPPFRIRWALILPRLTCRTAPPLLSSRALHVGFVDSASESLLSPAHHVSGCPSYVVVFSLQVYF